MENQTLVVLDGNQVDCRYSLRIEVADAVKSGPTERSVAYAQALNLLISCRFTLDRLVYVSKQMMYRMMLKQVKC
jgi:hypothetical protein